MISPNELQIGDWVLYGKGYAIIKAIGTHRSAILVSIDGQDELIEETYDIIDPIPLTDEILRKSGFGCVDSDSELSHYYLGDPHYCADMNLHIGTDKKGCFWLNYYSNSIYGLIYVHELQHAFSLLGIEKEITL